MNWFDTVSFEGFVTAPGGRTNPNLEMALAQSMKFAEQRDHSLCIYGPPGVGKTHLCYSVRNALRAMRLPVNLISFHDMIPWLRQLSPNHERKLGAFRQVDILVVDDLENL